MKTRQWIGILFASLAILSGCTSNNRGVVERPAFIARNTNALEIEKVELSDTATVLYMKAFYGAGGWIKVDPNSFLTDNQGKQYTIQSTDGVVLGEQFTMPESGEAEFTMVFPPIPSDLVSIDYSEGDYDGAWQFFGIQLTDKPIKVNLPKGFKDVAIDKNAVLPPVEFKAGKARLEGQILNYRSGMPAEVSVRVAFPSAEMTFPVDSTGKFSGEIDAFSTHPVTVYWANNGNLCFIAPGETTSIILNPAETSRRESRVLENRPSLGEPVYYSGYMASIAKELNQTDLNQFGKRHFDSYESYMAFIQSIENKTPEELKTFFLDEYQTKKAALDTLNTSPAVKQIVNSALDLSYSSDILDIISFIDRAYIVNNKLQSDRDATKKYYDTRKINLPDDFYDVLKDFSSLNAPQILYTQEAGWYATQWRTQILSKAMGTDKGTLFDMINVTDALYTIKEFIPLSEEQIGQLPAAYQKYIKNKNDELLQLIEANKNKTGFTKHDIGKAANKDVFPSIISKFKGKPILLDVWATWCAPCRMANEELKPVKAELADKDIVYVFVAGENSPLGSWENMIPDLHGEHFRLTAAQWDYVRSTFGVEGVPTYFFIDRKGNIKEKVIGYNGVQSMKEKILGLLNE